MTTPIDYAAWRAKLAPLSIQERHPAILAPRQRVIFWLIAAGVPPRGIALLAGCCLNTVKSYRDQIRNRIPGLTSNAAYGALATEIIQRLAAGYSPRPPLPRTERQFSSRPLLPVNR